MFNKNNILSPEARSAECISTVNNMLNSLSAKNKKSIAIMPLSCSAKSIQAIKDIIAMTSSLDRNVLLVDVNTEGNDNFDMPSGKGFADYVLENVDSDDCISYSESLHCDVMSTGEINNGLKVLHDVNFNSRLESIQDKYDLVFFNVTSTALSVVKSSLANKIGLSMVVLDKNIDEKSDLIMARDTLSECIGLVVVSSEKKSFKEKLAQRKK